MADLWRMRARRAVQTRLRDGLRPNGDTRAHYVVCGENDLAVQLVQELLSNDPTGATMRITVIVSHRRPPDVPDMRTLRGIRVIRADRLDEDTFRAAGLAGAQGVALLQQDDVGNIHAALCAQEVDRNVRVVMRMFNMSLGHGIRRIIPNCTVLSDASMAAPAFVAAALGEVAPTYFRHGGRTLFVARRADIRPEHVVCGLADTRDPNNPRVLPEDQSSADLVLAEATGEPAGTELAARRLVRARRWRRRPAVVLLRAMRSFATRKIGIATIVVLSVIVVLGVLLYYAEHPDSVWESLYLTLVTTISGADPDVDKETAAQVMQVVLNLAGLALIPLITAAVVDGIVNARLALNAGRLHTDRAGHVVVVGLGNVGTRVMWQLHDLGVEVVAIDKDPEARGASVARRIGVPLIIGDAASEETLETASVQTCQALVVVSTDDVSNLQAALNALQIRQDLRVVLRLYNGDFAERAQRAFGFGVSRSVSHLAAPSFAAALLNRAVIATIPIDRHAVLVAEVTVSFGSELAGREIGTVDAEGVRVIAIARAGQPRIDWTPPPPTSRLNPGDRLTVVVRRAGLSRLLKQASPPPPSPASPGSPARRPGRGPS